MLTHTPYSWPNPTTCALWSCPAVWAVRCRPCPLPRLPGPAPSQPGGMRGDITGSIIFEMVRRSVYSAAQMKANCEELHKAEGRSEEVVVGSVGGVYGGGKEGEGSQKKKKCVCVCGGVAFFSSLRLFQSTQPPLPGGICSPSLFQTHSLTLSLSLSLSHSFDTG